eukprot:14276329-Heterocapsa_arctica.AAC.1
MARSAMPLMLSAWAGRLALRVVGASGGRRGLRASLVKSKNGFGFAAVQAAPLLRELGDGERRAR